MDTSEQSRAAGEAVPHPDADLFPPTGGVPAKAAQTLGGTQLLQVLVGLVVGGAIGIGVGKLARALPPEVIARIDPSDSWWGLVAFLIALPMAMWVQIVVHELGHAAFGVAVGQRLHAIAFGTLRLVHLDGRWRRPAGEPTQGIGGFAYLLPAPDTARPPGAIGTAVMLVGGVAANLAASALVVAWMWSMPESLWKAALLAFVLVGMAFALLNLLPFRAGGFATDGYGLLALARRTPEGALLGQVRWAGGLAMGGVPAHAWPEASLPPLDTASLSPGYAVSALGLRMTHALTTGAHADADAAARGLRAQFDALPPFFQAYVSLSMAQWAAVARGDAALLAAWRARVGGSLLSDLAGVRAWLDAELAQLQGDAAARDDALARADAALPDEPDVALRALAQARVIQLRQDAVSHPAASPVLSLQA
jgi:hypothetical protein